MDNNKAFSSLGGTDHHKKEKKLSRANLIDAIKDMNETQLHKINNILKVRINKNN